MTANSFRPMASRQRASLVTDRALAQRLPWWNKPGEWLLVIATGISLVLLWLDRRDTLEKSGKDAEPDADAAPAQWWLLGGSVAGPAAKETEG